MISLKSSKELAAMAKACRISAQALKVAGEAIRPGMTTEHLDRIIHDYITSQGAKPSFLGYGGFSGSACISINNQVIHGIPSPQVKIKSGDIVSVDVGAFYEGFHGDNAATYPVGEITADAQKLLDVTRESLYRAIEMGKPGNRLGDLSHAVESYVVSNGLFVVKDYVGHGVGRELHEEPQIPNYGKPGRGLRLVPGMTLAIEPMVNQFSEEVVVLDDNWTVETAQGGLSAHFEHTVVITEDGCRILTAL